MGLTPRGKSPSKNTAAAIVGLRVRFELGARNGLRRVVFAMERNKKTSTTVEWVIEFQLWERRSRVAAFEQMANLRVGSKVSHLIRLPEAHHTPRLDDRPIRLRGLLLPFA